MLLDYSVSLNVQSATLIGLLPRPTIAELDMGLPRHATRASKPETVRQGCLTC